MLEDFDASMLIFIEEPPLPAARPLAIIVAVNAPLEEIAEVPSVVGLPASPVIFGNPALWLYQHC